MTQDDRRERLLDITERLFTERGLTFSMEDIAREAGSSKRTLYEAFPSKEALVSALIERVVTRVDAGFYAIIADTSLSPTDRLRHVLLEGASAHNQSLAQRLKEVERAYPDLFKRISDWSAEGWDRVARLVAEGARDGHFRDVDPSLLEILLAGLHRELASRGFQVGSERRLEVILGGMADILLEGLRPRREP